MKLLIVQSKNLLLNDNMIGIARAWATLFPVTILNINDSSPYDVFNNFHPDIVISNYDTLSNRAYLKCIEEFKPKVLQMSEIPISADIITYGNFKLSSDDLTSIYTSIISYDESEFFNLYSTILKINNEYQFKVFSRFQKRISQYCGELNPDTKPLAMNSCKIYIPTNSLDALNAIVLGKQILNCSDISEDVLNKDFIIKNLTTFHACKKIWKNFDINKIKEFI